MAKEYPARIIDLTCSGCSIAYASAWRYCPAPAEKVHLPLDTQVLLPNRLISSTRCGVVFSSSDAKACFAPSPPLIEQDNAIMLRIENPCHVIVAPIPRPAGMQHDDRAASPRGLPRSSQ